MSPPKKAILAVEDDQDSRDLIAEVLTSDGFALTRAGNGRDALSKLATMSPEPALVLLDVMMPEMDDGEFLRALGAQRLASLPVIVLPALAPGTCAHGARVVLRKPIELDSLRRSERDPRLGNIDAARAPCSSTFQGVVSASFATAPVSASTSAGFAR